MGEPHTHTHMHKCAYANTYLSIACEELALFFHFVGQFAILDESSTSVAPTKGCKSHPIRNMEFVFIGIIIGIIRSYCLFGVAIFLFWGWWRFLHFLLRWYFRLEFRKFTQVSPFNNVHIIFRWISFFLFLLFHSLTNGPTLGNQSCNFIWHFLIV